MTKQEEPNAIWLATRTYFVGWPENKVLQILFISFGIEEVIKILVDRINDEYDLDHDDYIELIKTLTSTQEITIFDNYSISIEVFKEPLSPEQIKALKYFIEVNEK